MNFFVTLQSTVLHGAKLLTILTPTRKFVMEKVGKTASVKQASLNGAHHVNKTQKKSRTKESTKPATAAVKATNFSRYLEASCDCV